MKFLLDIPLVMYVAALIWGEDENVTEEICVEDFPFMTSACWSTFVAKSLGVAIIAGAFLNKAPVIVNLIDTESTEGLSRGSVYADVLVYANGFAYGFLEGHPVTAYGENVALVLQSFVILLLVWKFTPVISLSEKFLVAVAGLAYVAGVSWFLPPWQHYLLIASQWPIMMYARGSQLYATYQVKHTGAQSIITTLMNLAGSLIRIMTTLKEVGWDLPVLTGFGIAVVLNGLTLLQFMMYWENTRQFVKRSSEGGDKVVKQSKQGQRQQRPTKVNKTKKKEL
ncbi:mannose-P-dolichol utilization defect 1 [Fistulifera solaris]|jgi:mannose-P-dolichol utilization defect protein 1|uniref:Mannose-P-dolichol utilization defect 1 n=1 Tax=Fistulifera solaris TaxID=1519565 RepID=A0A1Z5KSA7_FISSO|nr:mannose-P-dolichol utilization defect 1 [Fistulifera solaris]|eukprot:GAX29204.1 mannose-P-dolichol utilization defect 1 [Fistulifera solaris]